MKQSAIGTADSTWNPVRGCKAISPGCENCYAERIAGRYAEKGQTYYGIAKMKKDRPTWTGKVKAVPEHFYDPLDWQGRTITVGTMTDLFYEKVTQEWRDRVFAVMALCPQHMFQIETKRPQQMHDYFADPDVWGRIEQLARAIYFDRIKKHYPSKGQLKGPLRHTWLGVSIEDQATADERYKILQDIPAALRYIAAEPLLAEVTLRKFHKSRRPPGWVRAGGESGMDARPMRPAWVRKLRDECVEFNKPFMLHQWGAWLPVTTDELKQHNIPNSAVYIWPDGDMAVHLQRSDIRAMQGKGTLLDGVEWKQLPKID